MSENEQAAVVLEQQSTAMIAWASTLQVLTKQDADAAIARLSEIKAMRAQWVAYWKEAKESTHKAWKAIVAKEKAGTDICDQAERMAKQKVVKWQQVEAAKAAAEQARRQAETDAEAAAERARREKAAAKLKTPALRAERLAEAAMIEAPVVTVAPETIKGTRETWHAECTDLLAIIAAAANGNHLALACLTFNQKQADELARATKNAAAVPGVRFYSETNLSVPRL